MKVINLTRTIHIDAGVIAWIFPRRALVEFLGERCLESAFVYRPVRYKFNPQLVAGGFYSPG